MIFIFFSPFGRVEVIIQYLVAFARANAQNIDFRPFSQIWSEKFGQQSNLTKFSGSNFNFLFFFLRNRLGVAFSKLFGYTMPISHKGEEL
jgi:hypothetical protein